MNNFESLREQLKLINTKISDEEDKLKRDIGRRLRRIRKENKQTQESVSHVIGISRTRYTNIETGRAWLTTKALIMFCKKYKVDSSQILGV